MLAAAAAGLAAAMPRVTGAEAGDRYTLDPADPDHRTIVGKSEVITTKPSGEKHRTFTKTIDFEKPDSLGAIFFEGYYPENGTATVVLDADGKWQFTGSFPAQPKLIRKNLTTIALVIEYTAPRPDLVVGTSRYPAPAFRGVLAIPAVVIVDNNGGSWSRTGTNLLTATSFTLKEEYLYRWTLMTRPLRTSEALPAMPPNQTACENLAGITPGYQSEPICL
jgi:hypothetical protein